MVIQGWQPRSPLDSAAIVPPRTRWRDARSPAPARTRASSSGRVQKARKWSPAPPATAPRSCPARAVVPRSRWPPRPPRSLLLHRYLTAFPRRLVTAEIVSSGPPSPRAAHRTPLERRGPWPRRPTDLASKRRVSAAPRCRPRRFNPHRPAYPASSRPTRPAACESQLPRAGTPFARARLRGQRSAQLSVLHVSGLARLSTTSPQRRPLRACTVRKCKHRRRRTSVLWLCSCSTACVTRGSEPG